MTPQSITRLSVAGKLLYTGLPSGWTLISEDRAQAVILSPELEHPIADGADGAAELSHLLCASWTAHDVVLVPSSLPVRGGLRSIFGMKRECKLSVTTRATALFLLGVRDFHVWELPGAGALVVGRRSGNVSAY